MICGEIILCTLHYFGYTLSDVILSVYLELLVFYTSHLSRIHTTTKHINGSQSFEVKFVPQIRDEVNALVSHFFRDIKYVREKRNKIENRAIGRGGREKMGQRGIIQSKDFQRTLSARGLFFSGPFSTRKSKTFELRDGFSLQRWNPLIFPINRHNIARNIYIILFFFLSLSVYHF